MGIYPAGGKIVAYATFKHKVGPCRHYWWSIRSRYTHAAAMQAYERVKFGTRQLRNALRDAVANTIF